MRKIIILLMVVCAFTSVEAQTVVDNKGSNVVVNQQTLQQVTDNGSITNNVMQYMQKPQVPAPSTVLSSQNSYAGYGALRTTNNVLTNAVVLDADGIRIVNGSQTSILTTGVTSNGNLLFPSMNGNTRTVGVSVNGVYANTAGDIAVSAITETDPKVRAINGLVKSDGLHISAASPIYDYLQPNGSANALTNFPQFPESQVTGLLNDLAGKQATLVTGQNSSTVNGESLIDGHNIVVGGGGGYSPSNARGIQSGIIDLLADNNLVVAEIPSTSAQNYVSFPDTLNGKIVTMIFTGNPQGTTPYGTIVANGLIFNNVYKGAAASPTTGKIGDVYSFRYESFLSAWVRIK